MGDDDSKLMNTMMLMQLGLSLMSGETRKSGLAGFMEVAGKAGKEILPIAMQNLQNKSKMEKELALAAYDIVREERTAKASRIGNIQDFYIKEMIKKEFEGNEPKGTLRTVMKKNTVTLPDGQEFISWTPIDQVFDKGERAAYYMDMGRTGNEEMGVMPGDIRISSDLDAAAASAGNDPYQGSLTASQRGEHLALASVFEAALPDALNIQMNPQYGLYSGNLSTGTAGGIEKWLRTAARESKQLADNLGIPWLSDYFENTGNASLAALDVQMNKGMIFSGSMSNKASNYSTGAEDLYVGEGMGPDGVMIQGEWATDAYVKNLINNPSLDIAEQMQNRMGFLAARLKQPTGRLLADTIRRSIEEVKMLGLGAGDPTQVSHRLHQFTKDLYQQYVKHSLLGGTHITQSWAVDPGIYGKDRITIKDYQDGYYNFIGGSQNSPNLPIDMSWIQINGKIKSSAPAYSGTSDNSIDVKGPVNFFQIYEKYNPGGNQTFGGKEFTGNQ
jgi:predicted DNA-binding protein